MRKSRSGVLGVFAHLDAATDAIRRLRSDGFTSSRCTRRRRATSSRRRWRAPESPVRIFTLVGAFTGTAAGAALAIWASLDWPLIVGGKEIVSLPAFSVIMFEVTILLGALSTVAGLFINARLPRIGRPEALTTRRSRRATSASSPTSRGTASTRCATS